MYQRGLVLPWSICSLSFWLVTKHILNLSFVCRFYILENIFIMDNFRIEYEDVLFHTLQKKKILYHVHHGRVNIISLCILKRLLFFVPHISLL